MLDPKLLRKNLDEVVQKLCLRGFVLDKKTFLNLEKKRKTYQIVTQSLQTQSNQLSKLIGITKLKNEDITLLVSNVSYLRKQLTQYKALLEVVQKELLNFQLSIPNLPHDSVPKGKNRHDNQEIRRWGEFTPFDFSPKDHTSLGNNQLDFESAAKLSGTRFVVLRGGLARMQRAIEQFMLDLHTRYHGYQEIYVPYLVHEKCLYGTGQLPKFREEQFKISSGKSEFFLIPTAEVPLVNLARDKVFDNNQLPEKWVAQTPCFRSEAGSYGKDVHGMIRQHQFQKVELIQLVKPENSYQALEELTKQAEKVLQFLNLPYRVVELCTGDLGFSAAKTYDLEVWLPAQRRYCEISSCSNCESFQARRIQARWRNTKTKKLTFLHTINGSGLAVGRTLIAVMENYQQADGSIRVPKALKPYMDNMDFLSVSS
ncbi:serine--tRNA ligase [Coxiella endosymbiont of Amblyomma americanum]|uniref:serine--tRNA ligase n=1 Tax=Coxiella endosymbiont of Amblyomma americanum TaxID=325775 RepID=UPI00057F6F27|nr:serine--tRNA ligase [Coxiella endosymbiont of Amblyomma americanum]AJC50615.1 seryl-tRNA synthetase [Coxiella endosymbiont of Amblyomma americanum]AUJ58946.1 serine--tRNA ligase [Coxiella-like endosymbiont of Amblyomma americanum]